MNPLMDVFPVNVDSGPEFLAIYAVVVLVGGLFAKVAQRGAMALLEPASAPPPPAAGYRRPGPSERRLSVGALPSPEDLLHVGYLRSREAGMAEAIVAKATSEGWLGRSERPLQVALYPLPPDAARTSRELAALLHATQVDARALTRAAREVAKKHVTDVRRELVERGLLHPGWAVGVATLAYFVVAGLTVAIGGLRLARGLDLGRPIGFLAVMLVVVTAALLFFARTNPLTGAGRRYLEWLGEVTTSLREDVWNHRTQRPYDHALVGALAGPAAVPMVAALVPFYLWGGAQPGVSEGGFFGSDSSGSSSSCSSSSCGGGGGCGSSGCGGGGGCGG